MNFFEMIHSRHENTFVAKLIHIEKDYSFFGYTKIAYGLFEIPFKSGIVKACSFTAGLMADQICALALPAEVIVRGTLHDVPETVSPYYNV